MPLRVSTFGDINIGDIITVSGFLIAGLICGCIIAGAVLKKPNPIDKFMEESSKKLLHLLTMLLYITAIGVMTSGAICQSDIKTAICAKYYGSGNVTFLKSNCKKGTFSSNGQFFKYEVSDGKIYVYPYSSYDGVEVIEAKE